MQTGYIVKVGPGYPIPAVKEEDEAWNFMVIFSKKDRYVFQKRLLWFFILKLWENNIGLIKFFFTGTKLHLQSVLL